MVWAYIRKVSKRHIIISNIKSHYGDKRKYKFRILIYHFYLSHSQFIPYMHIMIYEYYKYRASNKEAIEKCRLGTFLTKPIWCDNSLESSL